MDGCHFYSTVLYGLVDTECTQREKVRLGINKYICYTIYNIYSYTLTKFQYNHRCLHNIPNTDPTYKKGKTLKHNPKGNNPKHHSCIIHNTYTLCIYEHSLLVLMYSVGISFQN